MAEKRYTNYELEVVAIVKALWKSQVYLLDMSFKIKPDYRAFGTTVYKMDLCDRVMKFVL